MIPGYNVSLPVVSGVFQGRDLEFTVIYTAVPAVPVSSDDDEDRSENVSAYSTAGTLDAFGTGLGLGDMSLNVGETIE